MTKSEIIGLLERVGFPVLVVLWFMFRLEGHLEAVEEVLQQIQITLASFAE